MTREELIGRWVPGLLGLGDFLEMLKAQHPDLGPIVDPKIAELRASADAGILANVLGVSLEELRVMVQTRSLDPRQHPSDLAG